MQTHHGHYRQPDTLGQECLQRVAKVALREHFVERLRFGRGVLYLRGRCREGHIRFFVLRELAARQRGVLIGGLGGLHRRLHHVPPPARAGGACVCTRRDRAGVAWAANEVHRLRGRVLHRSRGQFRFEAFRVLGAIRARLCGGQVDEGAAIDWYRQGSDPCHRTHLATPRARRGQGRCLSGRSRLANERYLWHLEAPARRDDLGHSSCHLYNHSMRHGRRFHGIKQRQP
mmetsp:Transcript_36002/g.99239  ORF Transcript_36002/g.99239 Transcript_36002/m.99239 type:complete len:230 (+) Transcript_36002:1247-1936(+)